MFKFYIIIFIEAFKTIPVITLLVLIIFLITFILMNMMMFIIFLDKFYRPNISQYPFNFVLDRIIPILFLITPLIFVFILSFYVVSIPYLYRYIFLLITHIFILIPVFHYWSNLRSWDLLNTKENYLTLDHPILFKHIAIALMYPAIWGIFLNLSRYLRLGVTLTISDLFFAFNLDILILFMFLVPFYTIWLKIILWKMMDIRYWLWVELSKLLNVIHIYFLRYKYYFYIFAKMHKIGFLWGTFVSLNNHVYPAFKKYSLFRNILKILYYNPYICILSVIAIIILECLITKGNLHYSLYILFLYPILYIICYFLNYLYIMPWVTDVCRADYFSRNWENPRYPEEFWVFFNDPNERYNFNWNFSDDEIQKINRLASKYFSKTYSYVPKLPFRLKNKPLSMRIKGTYKSYNGIKWMHTSAYHPLTGWFAKKFHERIVLLRSSWSHYNPILTAEKNGIVTNYPKNINYYKNFPNNTHSFKEAVESNLQTNYLPWIKNNVFLNKFENQNLDTRNQPEPDMVANFKNSTFIDKRIHGIDQKSGKADLGLSTIYSNMDSKIYSAKLKKFRAQMLYHCNNDNLNISAIDDVFLKLSLTSQNLDEHQLIWAKNIHLFPSTFIPPMRVPDHFSLENSTPEFINLIKQAEVKVTKISNYLYARKIPVNIAKPPEDLFIDSNLQKILGE